MPVNGIRILKIMLIKKPYLIDALIPLVGLTGETILEIL
jgi:hypothetical protein